MKMESYKYVVRCSAVRNDGKPCMSLRLGATATEEAPCFYCEQDIQERSRRSPIIPTDFAELPDDCS